MKHKITQSMVRLSRIKREFAKQRANGSHQALGYPAPLRKLALLGIKQGHSTGAVAQASGVTTNSLRNWLRATTVGEASLEGAVELKLISGAGKMLTRQDRGLPPKSEMDPVAKIRFRSGVELELPVSSLTPSWMVMLNGGTL